ncbi:hypothetical protein BDV98DRAFT_193838 [Pterulicium gracile]|uniref:Uncharacterized protein n=1 Tax=Pterulicium gracile TaxID=1884261 RepID=A0A5C3Q9N6_9AGAR|nr:hypothetical protein BDV98DRAFT_193838 [Pterula gracilis]
MIKPFQTNSFILAVSDGAKSTKAPELLKNTRSTSFNLPCSHLCSRTSTNPLSSSTPRTNFSFRVSSKCSSSGKIMSPRSTCANAPKRCLGRVAKGAQLQSLCTKIESLVRFRHTPNGLRFGIWRKSATRIADAFSDVSQQSSPQLNCAFNGPMRVRKSSKPPPGTRGEITRP